MSATGWRARATAIRKSSKAIAILDPDRYVEDDSRRRTTSWRSSTRPRRRLSARVARLDTGMAWAEDPPSRTRHLIANIEIEAGEHRGAS